MAKVQAKPWYTSKTILFNVLAFVVMVAGAFGFSSFEPSPEVVEYSTVAVTLINVLLRLVTKEAIK